MINYVDLSDWKKMKDIKIELHRDYGINISKDGREWRNEVKKWNKLWSTGDVSYYITHSNSKGYKATVNYEEAKIARNDMISRGKSCFESARDCDEGFERLNCCKLDLDGIR